MAQTGDPPTPGPKSDGLTSLGVGPGGQVCGTGPMLAALATRGVGVGEGEGAGVDCSCANAVRCALSMVGGAEVGDEEAGEQATPTRTSPVSIITQRKQCLLFIAIPPIDTLT